MKEAVQVYTFRVSQFFVVLKFRLYLEANNASKQVIDKIPEKFYIFKLLVSNTSTWCTIPSYVSF